MHQMVLNGPFKTVFGTFANISRHCLQCQL
jgi:hypothetical protein